MKLHEYKMSRSFFDHGQRSLKLRTCFFQETVCLFETKFPMKAYGSTGMEIYTNELGHMTKVASMPVYGENL